MLRVENVSKKYKLKTKNLENKYISVLNNVSLTIEEGKCHSLVGESGCGKSTLSRLIVGLEKADNGKIYFCGKNIHNKDKESIKMIKKNMHIVFQDSFSSLNPRMKVEDIIAEPMRNFYKMSYSEKKERIANYLEKVGLSPDDMKKYPHQFSGGQQKRINIARAISTSPKFIIFDEAVNSLDSTIKIQIIDLLCELKKEMNSSYLFISHDIEIAWKMADNISVMEKGEIVETRENVESLQEFTHPYSKELVDSILPIHPRLRKQFNKTI